MANTLIQIKRSGVSGNVPDANVLSYGELAINYADGLLFYKNKDNVVQSISGSVANAGFTSINVNSSLISANSNNTTLILNTTSPLNVVSDNTINSITIGIDPATTYTSGIVQLNDTTTSTNTNLAATANSVNSVYALAFAAFNKDIDLQSQINSNVAYFNAVNTQQNTNIDSVNTFANSAYNFANTTYNFANNLLQDIVIQTNTISTKNTNEPLILNPNGGTSGGIGIFGTPDSNVAFQIKSNDKPIVIGTEGYPAFVFYNDIDSNRWVNQVANASYTFSHMNLGGGYNQGNSTPIYTVYSANNVFRHLDGVEINGSLHAFSDARINSILSVGTGAYTVLPNLIAQFTGSSQLYTQINNQNLNGIGSTDIVATANNGTDVINYVDMGIAGSGFDYTSFNAVNIARPNDGYFILVGDVGSSIGGNVIYGTAGSGAHADILFIQNGLEPQHEVARFKNGQGLIIQKTTASTNTNTGALVVKGGVGVSGNVYATALYDNGSRVLTEASSGAGVQAAFDKANSANVLAQSAYDAANTVALSLSANVAYFTNVDTQQNTNINSVNTFAGAAFNQANTGASLAQSAYDKANISTTLAQNAFDAANTVGSSLSANVIYIASINSEQNTNISAINSFAQSAYNVANTSNNIAQAAFDAANTVANGLSANVIYIASINSLQNTNISSVNTFAQAGFDAANTVASGLAANVAYFVGVNDSQNTNIDAVNTFAGAAFNAANTVANNLSANLSYISAINSEQNTSIQIVYDAANTVASGLAANVIYLNAVNTQQNTNIGSVNTFAQAGFDAANTVASGLAANVTYFASVDTEQNTNISAVNTFTQSAYNEANTVSNSLSANVIYLNAVNTQQNNNISAVNTFTQAAYDAANTVASGLAANVAYITAVDTQQNTNISAVNTFAQAGFDAANTVASGLAANVAYFTGVDTQQNTNISSVNTFAQAGFDKANSANVLAQAAYDTANTKFSSSGGTISGPVLINSTLEVTGNVVFTANVSFAGNVTTVSANNLILTDNMIYLNSGANVANPDIGITGAYDDGIYRHTGFFRDATDGIWKLFDQYLPEPDASPYIDTSNTSFRIADFQANNVYLGHITTYSTALVANLNSQLLNGENGSYYLDWTNTTNKPDPLITVTLTGDVTGTASATLTDLTSNTITISTAVVGAGNTGATIQAAFDKANSANILAQAAYDAANTISNDLSANVAYLNAVNTQQNTNISAVNTFAGAAFNKANDATTLAQNAFDAANSSNTIAFSAYNQANTVASNLAANVAYFTGVDTQQNTNISAVNTFAQAGFDKANSSLTIAQNAYDAANTVASGLAANIAYFTGVDTQQNTNISAVNTFAGAAYNEANTVSSNLAANVAYLNAVNTQQNTNIGAVNTFTQSAFDAANTVSNSLSANVSYFTGVDTQQNTNISAVNTFAQAGFDAANTVSNSLAANVAYFTGVDTQQNTNISAVNTFAQAGFDAANTVASGLAANVAYIAAVDTQQNTNISAVNTFAGAAFNKANDATTLAQNAFNTANTDVTNISIIAGSYGNSAVVPVVTLAANGRIESWTSVLPQSGTTSQVGVVQLNDTLLSTSTSEAATANAVNAVYKFAQSITTGGGTGTVTSVNIDSGGGITVTGGPITTSGTFTITNSGVLSISTGSATRITANASTGFVQLDLATIGGLSAGSYTYPSLQVDSYGRITTISNLTPVTSISGATGRISTNAATGIVQVDLTQLAPNPVGTYGSGTAIPVITVDDYGRTTNVVTSIVTPDWTNVTNKPDPVVTVTLTGDVSGSGNATLVDLASNTINITVSAPLIQASYDTANSVQTQLTSNVAYFTGVDTQQNTNISAVNTFTQSAYDAANSANNVAFSAYNKANTTTGGGGATGGGSDKIFWENDITVTTDYTITTNKNAMTAGPVSINPGVTITIPANSVWTIV